MADDKIIQHSHYKEDPLPRLEFSNLGYSAWLTKMHQIYQGEDPPEVPASISTSVDAFVNAGRWLWMCVACNSAITAEVGQPSICVECSTQGWLNVVFPSNREEIEAELLKQPGHRAHAPIRQWRPGWGMSVLEDRTARAQAAVDAGVPFPVSLSIGATRIWSVGEILTAANKNTYERTVLEDLAGRNGPVEYEGPIVIDSLTTTERNAITLTGTGGLGASGNGLVIYNSTLNVLQRYENGAWVDHTHANTLTLASGAQGDVLFLNTSGTVTRLTAGTDRQALRTHGSNADPTFADLEDLRVAATTARGDVFYVGSNGRLNRLAAGTSNFFFQTKGSTADPVWASISTAVTFVRLTTGTSWTVPTGTKAVYVEVIGGGGGGAAGSALGSPGEGGLIARHFFLASSLGSTVTYAIGAGGAAASAGGNTVFAGHAVGLGGRTAVAASQLYDRPEATGQIGANGGRGGNTNAGGVGGETGLPTTVGGGAGGTAGTGSSNGVAGGAGTNSLNGLGSGGGGGGGGFADPQVANNGGAGGAGGIPGGGGGGGGRGSPHGIGGNGARGEIRIWYW